MANIPSIPNTAPVQDIQIGTKVDSRYRLAAIGAEANVFSEAMGVVSDYELRKQKAEEVAGFNSASIVLNNATSDYQHGLKAMDDKDIVPKWQEQAQKTKDELLQTTQGWSPAAKAKFGQTLDTWASDSTIQFQVAGDHLASQRRKATAIAASQEFLQTGDPAYLVNAKQAITSAQKAGDMTPDEAAMHIGVLTRGLQTNQILNGIEADPVSTLRDIKAGQFKDVPPKQLKQLEGVANKAITVKQNAGRDDILQRHDAGEIIDEGEIASKEATGDISPAGAKAVRLGIAQKDLKDANASTSEMLLDVDSHLWTEDKSPDKTAQQFKDEAAILPATLRRRVNDRVDMKVKEATKGQAGQEKPVETEIYAQMKQDRERGALIPLTQEADPGFKIFGIGTDPSYKMEHLEGGTKALDQMSDDDVEEKYGKGMTKQKLSTAERTQAATIHQKMMTFFKQKPDATYEEANDQRKKFEQPYVMAYAKEAVAKNIPVMVTGEDDFNSLPAGATFIYNGRVGTKH
jgi:hypothetical protein